MKPSKHSHYSGWQATLLYKLYKRELRVSRRSANLVSANIDFINDLPLLSFAIARLPAITIIGGTLSSSV